MTQKITLLFVLVCSSFTMFAQKKKDLLIEIDTLKSELQFTKNSLSESRKNEKVSLARMESAESQLGELRDANAALLKNLKGFTEISNKNSETIENALKSLNEKERQLKVVNEALSSTDSTTLAVFTLFKGSLEGSAKTSVKNGAVVISIPNLVLFGENDHNYSVAEEAQPILAKLAKAINTYPDIRITIEGNSNALEFKDASLIDNWDLSARQAAAVARALQNKHSVNPKRMDALGKSKYNSESVVETVTEIIVQPNFDRFYAVIKESMKN